MKTIILPSGAKLEITLSPFSVSKSLYQAVLEEARGLKLDPLAEIDVNLFKDLFCLGMSSKKIEDALTQCFKRVTYNGLKIDADTFESKESREDYFTVCLEVSRENIEPFLKSLYAEFARVQALTKSSQV